MTITGSQRLAGRAPEDGLTFRPRSKDGPIMLAIGILTLAASLFLFALYFSTYDAGALVIGGACMMLALILLHTGRFIWSSVVIDAHGLVVKRLCYRRELRFDSNTRARWKRSLAVRHVEVQNQESTVRIPSTLGAFDQFLSHLEAIAPYDDENKLDRLPYHVRGSIFALVFPWAILGTVPYSALASLLVFAKWGATSPYITLAYIHNNIFQLCFHLLILCVLGYVGTIALFITIRAIEFDRQYVRVKYFTRTRVLSISELVQVTVKEAKGYSGYTVDLRLTFKHEEENKGPYNWRSVALGLLFPIHSDKDVIILTEDFINRSGYELHSALQRLYFPEQRMNTAREH